MALALFERSLTFARPTRRTVRRDYRNRPENPYAVGALTGEADAMHYVRVGEIDLAPDQVLVAYADGLEHVVRAPAFRDIVRRRDARAMLRLCRRRVITEGSRVSMLVDSNGNGDAG